MLYTLLCIFLFLVLSGAAYYIAQYHLRIKMQNEELKEYQVDASLRISELESDIALLRTEVQQESRQQTQGQVSGWDAFNARG